MGCTADGASVNRKLIKLHNSEGNLLKNKTLNPAQQMEGNSHKNNKKLLGISFKVSLGKPFTNYCKKSPNFITRKTVIHCLGALTQTL